MIVGQDEERCEAETPVPSVRNAEKMLRCRVRMLKMDAVVCSMLSCRDAQAIHITWQFPEMKANRGLWDGLRVRS